MKVTTVPRSLLSPLAAVGLLLIAACSSPQATTPTGTGAGRIDPQPTALDLGRVPFDAMTEARYELVNTGSGTVHLGKPTVKLLSGC